MAMCIVVTFFLPKKTKKLENKNKEKRDDNIFGAKRCEVVRVEVVHLLAGPVAAVECGDVGKH
jgi:hypothetical protein